MTIPQDVQAALDWSERYELHRGEQGSTCNYDMNGEVLKVLARAYREAIAKIEALEHGHKFALNINADWGRLTDEKNQWADSACRLEKRADRAESLIKKLSNGLVESREYFDMLQEATGIEHPSAASINSILALVPAELREEGR